uniref:Putative eukaryotic translation initiation factor 2-alpha kinase 1 n=1 Tax=Corethrella appendiculata TaxID=1370023 RepID=U5EPR7_9DIPT
MTLCHLTLREWLDERNKYEDFDDFYTNFFKDSTNRFNNVIPKNTFCAQSNYLSTMKASSNSINNAADDVEIDCFDDENQHQIEHLEIVTDILLQLLNGLNYIHSRSIVHHDIKPSNIFVSLDHNNRINVQLGDFGLSCPTHTGVGFGTPMYAAPEQLDGKCSPKSDIYSLGIILLELLTSFSTDMERAEMIKNVRRGKLPHNLNAEFANLLKFMLHTRPQKRPDTQTLIQTVNCMKLSRDKIIQDLKRRLSDQSIEIETLRGRLSSENSTTDTITTTEIFEDETQQLRLEIQQKHEQILNKDVEIETLRTQIKSFEIRNHEMKSKDEEIVRLKKLLDIYQNRDCES